MNNHKITILGAGNIGAASAVQLLEKTTARVCLYDVVEGLAEGKVMDICHGFMSDRCCAASTLEDALDKSQIVIITAGIPRHEGQSRNDLFETNVRVITHIGKKIHEICKDAFVLVVTNPVDALTTVFNREFPSMNACGFGCSLDMYRLRYLLSRTVNVAAGDISAFVIGTHNDYMLPLVRLATTSTEPICDLISDDILSGIIQETKLAGSIIVKKLQSRGSHIAASMIIADIVKSFLNNEKRVFSLNVPYKGNHYEVCNCSPALPVVLGQNGPEKVIEFNMTKSEQEAFRVSIGSIKEVIVNYVKQY